MQDIYAEQFEYHIFQSLDYRKFLSYFDIANGTPDWAEYYFLEWLDNFYHRSNLFYLSQFDRQIRQAYRQFREMMRISEDDSLDCIMQEEWDVFYRKIGLRDHELESKAYREDIKRFRAEIRKKRDGADMFMHLLSDKLGNRPRNSEINALWFDDVINNNEQTKKMLRELPYELYLKTKHWAKVRAAQMLIHKAVCQEQSHYEIGESWYTGDWEADIHVHHLTYINIGNERYSDLVVLCATHHSTWHREVEAHGSSRMVIADDE
jgi:hypothetical protein